MDRDDDRLENHQLRETREMRSPVHRDRAEADAADSASEVSGSSDTPGASTLAGEAAGGIGGSVAGAAIGTLIAGPIGAAIGVIAGAVGGWWAGKAAADPAVYSDEDDTYYRSHYESRADRAADRAYDDVRPGYYFGHLASRNPEYHGRDFEEVETDLQKGWTEDLRSRYGEWSAVRGHARDAFLRRGDASHDTALRDADSTVAQEARERHGARVSSALDGLRRDDTVGY